LGEYYPFGMKISARSGSEDYRYGFNGMEKDEEFNGTPNTYDFGARIYDSRIGRWLAIDINNYQYPWSSPYTGLSNNPILFIDPDGKAVIIKSNGKNEGPKKVKFNTLEDLLAYSGPNEYIQSVVESFYYFIDNDATGVLRSELSKFVAYETSTVQQIKDGAQARSGSGHIRWDNTFGASYRVFVGDCNNDGEWDKSASSPETKIIYESSSMLLMNEIIHAIHYHEDALGQAQRRWTDYEASRYKTVGGKYLKVNGKKVVEYKYPLSKRVLDNAEEEAQTNRLNYWKRLIGHPESQVNTHWAGDDTFMMTNPANIPNPSKDKVYSNKEYKKAKKKMYKAKKQKNAVTGKKNKYS
jgi:RHS repeat-associated protein